ncbi:hypothetical protein KO481_22835 [Nocardia sp. NEAU-G5]|uniref:Uncharacterized protein n=1 Tax=Nocardia albiluteola TaxID=2842303 RepID=A0ABS6B232_9NOCA|nr:hypothetical protein [Nocardia albiluteola]MBU3064357.1 hypothetical protein [Nocardia albiluteola]
MLDRAIFTDEQLYRQQLRREFAPSWLPAHFAILSAGMAGWAQDMPSPRNSIDGVYDPIPPNGEQGRYSEVAAVVGVRVGYRSN